MGALPRLQDPQTSPREPSALGIAAARRTRIASGTAAALLLAVAGCGDAPKAPAEASAQASSAAVPTDGGTAVAASSTGGDSVGKPAAPAAASADASGSPEKKTAAVEPRHTRPLDPSSIEAAVAALASRAAFLEELGSLESAIQVRKEWVRALLLLRGRDHWETRAAEEGLAALEQVAADPGEKPKQYRRMRQLQERFLRQSEQENLAGADVLAAEGRKLADDLFGADSFEAAVWRLRSAALSQSAGKHEPAETELRETKALLEKLTWTDRPEYADCLQMLSESCKALGKNDEAVQIAGRAAEVRQNRLR